MTNFLSRAAKRWALCATAGLALSPIQSFSAEPANPNEGASAIERELQKLYERDGRKMPPMRKPVVPAPGQKPAAPVQRPSSPASSPGTPQSFPDQNAQPISPPKSNGMMQRINPFSRKPTGNGQSGNSGATPPTAPPVSNSAPPVQTSAPRSTAATPSTIPASTAPAVDDPFANSVPNQPAANFTSRESAPIDELDNPFPDETEAQADGLPARTAPPARPTPPPVRFDPPQQRNPVAAPARNDAPPAPPGRAADENPFTGLKLESTPAPSRPPELPEPRRTPPVSVEPVRQDPPVVRTPSREANDNPFETPALSAPGVARELPKPPTRETEPTAPNPTPAPLSAPSTPEPSQPPPLTVPESDPFEAPTVRSTKPELRTPRTAESSPSIPAPPRLEVEEERPALPAPKSEEAGPSLGGVPEDRFTPTSRPSEPMPTLRTPARSEPPALPATPKVEPRVQPPKQLNPEPAAELPRNPANEHERKLRLIGERRGTGFKGFCPVTLRDERDLVDASPEFSSTFDGVTYTFATEQAKSTFDRNPLKYVPAAGGNDVIIQGSKGHQVPGSLDYAVWYKDRLHLFSSRDTLETFIETLSTTSAPKP